MLMLADVRFTVGIDSGELDLRRGERGISEAGLTTTPEVLAALVWHGRALDDAIRAGDAEVVGDPQALESMFDVFRRSE
jgi:alkyl sulfatase BDS1-like metallo-beta-lactamase superfamily hydrolase